MESMQGRDMPGIAVIFGGMIGLSLGLTGGGGGVFAVPLLVYGMSLAPREAVGVSLASVGGTALFGAIPRLTRGEVELTTGILFAIAGMAGAPAGNYLAGMVHPKLLLVLFAVLMFVVAWQMWANPRTGTTVGWEGNTLGDNRPTCQRDEHGKIRLTSGCALSLTAAGFLTGMLTGMFGIGGGFLVVPALVLFSGMGMHQAIATSLFVIFLVSTSGFTSYLATGRELPVQTTLEFLGGGAIGMLIGGSVSRKIKGPGTEKGFCGWHGVSRVVCHYTICPPLLTG